VDRRTQITPRRALTVMVLVGAAAIFAIWAVYGFRYAPSPAHAQLLHSGGLGIVSPPVRGLAAVGHWIDAWHLLPNAYTQGFILSQATAEALPAYLNGEVRAGGWWYYFPFAFLVKTPSVLLILAAAGMVGLLWPVRPGAPRPRAFVLLPVAVYLACAMTSGINLGVRHILPVYPFVLCLAAVAMHELIESRRWLARLVLAAAAVLALARFPKVWPSNLTFFNSFAGGPLNGARFLTDSNLDWGQHLKSLKQWMDANQVGQINLAYAGTIDPESYGIKGTCLPGSPSYAGVTPPLLPGYVAISATVQSGVYLPEESRLLYAGFKDLAPVAIVGNSIRVYWVEDWPVRVPEAGATEQTLGLYARFADTLLFEAQSPDFAMKYYRAYLSARPTDGEILAKLGLALLMKGVPAEAHPVLQQAVGLAANPARLSSEIVLALLSFGRTEEALAYAQAAVERTPRDALAYDALGTALAFGGRDEEALAAFARSLELAPAASDVRAHEEAIRRRLAAARPDLL
jgi:tetratricopeptide (TPR) repeat protein